MVEAYLYRLSVGHEIDSKVKGRTQVANVVEIQIDAKRALNVMFPT